MICCQCKKCGECGKTYSSNSTYAEICKDFEKKKMTNFEKIKQMSVDEMAQNNMGGFLGCPYLCSPDIDCNEDKNCIYCVKHWLESEVEE